MCGNVLQASRPNRRTYSLDSFAGDIFFFFPKDTQHLYFSLLFFFCLSPVVLQRKRRVFLWNIATFHLFRTIIFIFFCLKILFFHFPSVSSQFKVFLPVVSFANSFIFFIFLTQSPSGHSRHEAECKPGHTMEPGVLTESISLSAPALFFSPSQRGQPPGTGTRA